MKPRFIFACNFCLFAQFTDNMIKFPVYATLTSFKVIHPEVDDSNLGIKSLDEPSAFQSDPSVLDLRLRAMAKQSSAKAIVVKKVENVGKNSKVIENWIKDISDLHRSKPSPSVHYSKLVALYLFIHHTIIKCAH